MRRTRKTLPLSKRQRQCLEAKLDRLTAKEAAQQLNISHNTVQMHWRVARWKLGVSSTLSAASMLEQGDVDAGGEDAVLAEDAGSTEVPLDNFVDRLFIGAAAMALGLIVLLSMIFIAAALSVILIHLLHLDRWGPFYGMLRNAGGGIH